MAIARVVAASGLVAMVGFSAAAQDLLVTPSGFEYATSAGSRWSSDVPAFPTLRGGSGNEPRATGSSGSSSAGVLGETRYRQSWRAANVNYFLEPGPSPVLPVNRISMNGRAGAGVGLTETPEPDTTPEAFSASDMQSRFTVSRPLRYRVTGLLETSIEHLEGDPRFTAQGRVELTRGGVETFAHADIDAAQSEEIHIDVSGILVPRFQRESVSFTLRFDAHALADAPSESAVVTVEGDVAIELFPYCPADLDEDGTPSLDDLDAFVAAFVAGTMAADLNGSGSVDLDDLDLFVRSFTDGCE